MFENGACVPQRLGVDAIDKALDAVLDFIVAELIHPDKGGKIGIKAEKCLRTRPLVLHNAQEIHHLVA